MPLNKHEHKNLNASLRNLFANNRVSSFSDILQSLEDKNPELANSLRNASKRLTSETYLARYCLRKFVKEGWLKINGHYTEVQLSPELCSFCFKSIEDIYLIDIDRNRYCGWDCAEKCCYYSDPYENNLDTYHSLFNRFAYWLPECRKHSYNQETKNYQELETLSKEIDVYISDIHYEDFRSLHKDHSDVDIEIHRMLFLLDKEVKKLKGLMGALNCKEKGNMILCRQCADPVNEHYLINHRGDYFCGDNCHEIYHEAYAQQFSQFDDDHPYFFDYSSIRQEYIYWFKNWVKLLQEKTKDSNAYAQWEADDLIDKLDEIIWAYKDFILTEGDDGLFAYEIYQYTLKLREIQKQILKWRPEHEMIYACYCYYDYDDADTPKIINDFLNDVAAKEGSILAENWSKRPHPFHEYFDWIFDFEWERDYWLDILSPYFQTSPLRLETYTAHLCDGGCNDYLDLNDNDNWSNGWFYCDSCLQDKDIGEMTHDQLKNHLQYYETNNDKLQPIIHDKSGDYSRYKSLIRRACRIHEIEMPDWVII